MNGRELLEALRAVTPEGLEREVVAEYTVPDSYATEYVLDTLVLLVELRVQGQAFLRRVSESALIREV